MKQKLLLKSLVLLFALIAGSSSVWAADVTASLTLSDGNFADGKITWVLKDGSDNAITVQQLKGSSTSNVNLSYVSAPRLYKGHVLSFTGAAGYFVKSISITYSGTYYGNSMTAGIAISEDVVTDNTTAVSRTWSDVDNGTHVVSSVSSDGLSQIYIQNVASSNNVQLRPTAISITYNKVALPEHTATFSVNGVENNTNYKEGEDIVFPADPSNIGEKVFVGWAASAIVGTTNVEPAFVSSATMGTSDITYYAVFASQADVATTTKLTITKDTENFPTAYGTAKTFTEYTLEGKKFKIQQAYVNGGKLQWRSGTDTSNGAGTIYNTQVLVNIKSIVLTYNGDSNKNFTLKIGDAENPSSGTSIEPTTVGDVSTFDCSSYNKNYFVLTNGDKAGYLSSIAITYEGFVTQYSAYCTTFAVPTNVAITIAASGYSTIASGYGLDFAKATPAGLEAYVVPSITASAVSLSAVDEAPASTGIVLKGEAGTEYTIPVKDGAAAVGTNKLQAAVSSKGIDANSVYILKGGQFCLVTGASIVPAGKAYLLASDVPAEAHELTFDFGDETAINALENATKTDNGAIYDLSGRRVENPTKGIYIINGKKVIFK